MFRNGGWAKTEKLFFCFTPINHVTFDVISHGQGYSDDDQLSEKGPCFEAQTPPGASHG